MKLGEYGTSLEVFLVTAGIKMRDKDSLCLHLVLVHDV